MKLSKELFGRAMNGVDVFNHPYYDFELSVMVDNLEYEKGMKVIEVGCNDTDLCQVLHRAGCEVWGVEVNPPNRGVPEFKFIKKDFRNVELPENYFDIAVDISALHHIGLGHYGEWADPNGDIECANKIYKILKNNGVFYSTSDRYNAWVGDKIQYYVNDTFFYRSYDYDSFMSRIASRFKVEEVKFYEWGSLPIKELTRQESESEKKERQIYCKMRKVSNPTFHKTGREPSNIPFVLKSYNVHSTK